MKEDIILKLDSYMTDNKVTTEELIEDFYQKNKTAENEEILRRETIFNKTLIRFMIKEFV